MFYNEVIFCDIVFNKKKFFVNIVICKYDDYIMIFIVGENNYFYNIF